MSCIRYVYKRLHSEVKRQCLFTSLKLSLVSNLRKKIIGIPKRFTWLFAGSLWLFAGGLWSFPVFVTRIGKIQRRNKTFLYKADVSLYLHNKEK